MAVGTPRSLSAFCRTVLPHLVAATDKRRLLKTAAEVVGTDRWNSFDRFHEPTRTLVRHYEHSGAKAEVESIQTGSRIGTGRWIIQGAQDVDNATVDVVGPVRRRILAYADCPWHAVQWPHRGRGHAGSWSSSTMWKSCGCWAPRVWWERLCSPVSIYAPT